MSYEDDQDEIIESAREIESLRAELDSLRNFLGDMSLAMPVGRVIGLVESLRAERDRYRVVVEEANWKGAGFEASAKKAEAENQRLRRALEKADVLARRLAHTGDGLGIRSDYIKARAALGGEAKEMSDAVPNVS